MYRSAETIYDRAQTHFYLYSLFCGGNRIHVLISLYWILLKWSIMKRQKENKRMTKTEMLCVYSSYYLVRTDPVSVRIALRES